MFYSQQRGDAAGGDPRALPGRLNRHSSYYGGGKRCSDANGKTKFKPTLQVSLQKVKNSGQTLAEEKAPFPALTSKPPARPPPCANTSARCLRCGLGTRRAHERTGVRGTNAASSARRAAMRSSGAQPRRGGSSTCGDTHGARPGLRRQGRPRDRADRKSVV